MHVYMRTIRTQHCDFCLTCRTWKLFTYYSGPVTVFGPNRHLGNVNILRYLLCLSCFTEKVSQWNDLTLESSDYRYVAWNNRDCSSHSWYRFIVLLELEATVGCLAQDVSVCRIVVYIVWVRIKRSFNEIVSFTSDMTRSQRAVASNFCFNGISRFLFVCRRNFDEKVV